MIMKELLLVLFLVPALAGGSPQPKGHPDGAEAHAPLEQSAQNPAEIFALVASGLRHSDHASISRNFGRQVYVSLKGGENGYFSSNQASYVVQSFFASRRPASFTFTTIDEGDEPFATGSGLFLMKGTRETLQVYVALARQGKRWVISQFNVY